MWKLPAITAPLVTAALLALVSSAHAQTQVGKASAVNPISELERGSSEVTISIGTDLEFQDRVVTSEEGLVQVLFVDGSAFTVGPNARVVIDEFVYNPSDQSGELVAEVTQGALRFVGGALSKRGRGRKVNFRTKNGTLGVRGAIVNIDTNPPCDRDPCPTLVASLVFGDELIFEQPGQPPRRIYDSGYSLVVRGEGGPGNVGILPSSRLDMSQLQMQLTGQPGTNGGATEIPTAQAVLASGLPRINSFRAPQTVLPRPRPILVRTQFSSGGDDVGASGFNNVLDDTIVEAAASDFIENDVAGEEDGPIEPPDEPREFFIAATVTPDEEEAGFDAGVVGVTAPTGVPLTAELIRNDENVIIGLNVNGNLLPFPEEEGETPIPPFQTNFNDEEIRGTALRGPNNFVFYHFEEDIPNAGEDGALYVVAGELTPVEQVLPSVPIGEATIREYGLSDDFQRRSRGISSSIPQLNPLIAREFGDALNNAVETSFFIAERGGERSFAQSFYAGLLIDGQGAEQRSAVMVEAGDVLALAEQPALSGLVRGTYRLSSDNLSVSSSGGTGSLLPQNGTGGFYGANGANFVYMSGPSSTTAQVSPEELLIFDNQNALGPLTPDQLQSQFTVVGSLESQTPVGDFNRRSGTFDGVAAGIVESSVNGPSVFKSTNVGDMVIAFDPSRSAVGGFISVDDTADADSIITRYRFAYGLNLSGDVDASPPQSAYIDNDTFGAIEARAPSIDDPDPTTALRDDGAITPAVTPPRTYVVSSDAVPQEQFFAEAGVTPCECKFLEWGWWGSEVITAGEEGELIAGRTHLGTWAAGEVTAASDLPTTGTGTFEGHAVGSVVNSTGESVQQYVAAGDARVTFDFGARSGNVSISNFDNRSFGGDIAQVPAVGGGNQFAGDLAGSGLSGSTVGAFVNGPEMSAQGVIGNFGVSGEGYSATGTYVGER